MKSLILKLARIAESPDRKIIGLMSGTSLDGLDIALCQFKGTGKQTQFKLLQFKTINYTQTFRERIRKIAFQPQVDLCELTLLNASIGTHMAELVSAALEEWKILPEEIDLIASHGQTIYHAPQSFHHLAQEPNATLQIGDADHIAVKTGIITLSDFRQKHIAAGGEGAPLVFYGDQLLLGHPQINRVLLNIGGIANFSWIPASDRTDISFSTDTGPGNTLMNQLISSMIPGEAFDRDARIAKQGTIQQELLQSLKTDPFFQSELPRTTGPEHFNLNYLQEALERTGKTETGLADLMATLCAFSAQTIIDAIVSTTKEEHYEIYLSGGGMHNPLLSQMISEGLNQTLRSTAELGIDPDAKEAILFALLANECIAGERPVLHRASAIPEITMGKISLPAVE